MSMSVDHSKSKAVVWAPIVISALIAIGTSIGWGYERWSHENKENLRLISEYIVKMRNEISSNKIIFDRLNEEYVVDGWGVLESYVIKVRSSGGHQGNRIFFELIQELNKGNIKLLSLIDGYSAHIVTEEFRSEAEKYREHAKIWIVRAKSITNVSGSDDQLPVWKPFPRNFPDAVELEIQARGGQ